MASVSVHGWASSLVQVRELSRRVRAARLGWPRVERLAEARLLESLRDGPRTPSQLAARLGHRCVAEPLWRLVRSLSRRGLIARLRRGGRSRPALYALAVKE